MDLFQQQASNRRRTWLVMFVFVAFLFLLGYGFDVLYLGTEDARRRAGGAGRRLVSARTWLSEGRRAVLASAGAGADRGSSMGRPAPEADRLKYRQFANVAEEMAIAAGLPARRCTSFPTPTRTRSRPGEIRITPRLR